MKMHLHDNKKTASKDFNTFLNKVFKNRASHEDFNTFLNGVFKNRASHGKFAKIELNSCSPLCTHHLIDFWT